MADKKKEPEIHKEHWDRTKDGFKAVIDGLEDAGFDMSKKAAGPHGPSCVCHELEAYGEEITRRNLNPASVGAMNLRVGARIQFNQDYELNGQPHTENVDGVIVGIFYDGFVYMKLRHVGGNNDGQCFSSA